MNDEARTAILNRIRQALPAAYLPAARPTTPPPPAPPPFAEPLAAVFGRALAAVYGQLHPVPDDPAAVAFLVETLTGRGVRRVLSWEPAHLALPGLESALAAAGIEPVAARLNGPDRRADLARLDPLEVGLTAAAAGLARTGSLVVWADRDRGRLASLLPPVHYAVLRVEQLYPDLAAWLATLEARTGLARYSSTIVITGPSRTADIAQTLTLGAHGPRELHVVLIGSSP
ncbi:MAG: LUD domain-containing protein [Anaerolineae bacterium]|nr:lactate utilization protein [Caldilineales bacterium]MDW8269281.1 LUD domain-containing protein [Anaerolineae bacterium]